MGYLMEILRGVFIGVANIIPGVSGGTIALSMGVYEKIISAVNNLKKDFKSSIKILLPYGIGAVLGILGLAFIIKFLLDKFPIPTVFAFIGLIIGGLPSIYARVKNEKFKITHIISFILLASLIIIPTIVSANMSGGEKILELNFISVVILFALGVIAAASMVVPGVSGSMILMMLGYYQPIIDKVTLCVESLVNFDFGQFFGTVGLLLPFGVGVLTGVLLAAKLIERLLKVYPNATMWGIIALVVTSPFAILYGMDFSTVNFVTIIISILTFVIGYYAAIKFSKAE